MDPTTRDHAAGLTSLGALLASAAALAACGGGGMPEPGGPGEGPVQRLGRQPIVVGGAVKGGPVLGDFPDHPFAGPDDTVVDPMLPHAAGFNALDLLA